MAVNPQTLPAGNGGAPNAAPNTKSDAGAYGIDYLGDMDRCTVFLQTYKAVDAETGMETLKYVQQLQNIANRRSENLHISLDDLIGWGDDENLVQRIQRNAKRYIHTFTKAADTLMPEPDHNLNPEAEADVFEVFRNQRRERNAASGADEAAGETEEVSTTLDRTFQVTFSPLTKTKTVAIRDVKASQIGQLTQIRGIVTRVSDVKPKLVIATYICDECSAEMYVEIPGQSYMPKTACEGRCKEQKIPGRLVLQTRGSKFVKFQDIKIQEMPDQVPIGHIPRTMHVRATGTNTRQCGPGDSVIITGIYLPSPHESYESMKMGLLHHTYLECVGITREKKNYAELSDEISEDISDRIDLAGEDDQIYEKLAMSLAPEIYGHEDVKKALLLMLIGASTRRMKDGMNIRGDINICLMGDPGVAKSQLLKHIASVAPRGVYTTGKGSSGVGLTAAVTRDPVTKETALEGGALVLADRGICCIDEFDKMEESDRTAIHEVMEQQTVSIAKAGVTTTLNARTSILAAANPLFGRYNKRYSPSDNINLPAALLSRFDLMFLILDKTDLDNDTALANHVTHVHRFNKHPPLSFEPLEPSFIRAYISQVRKVMPYIPLELSGYIVEEYVSMRQAESEASSANGQQSVMTARQLLSILRLALALARLRFDERVSHGDIEEAIRLVKMSKASVESEEDDVVTKAQREDPTTRIYGVLLMLAKGSERGEMSVLYSELEPVVLAKGFSRNQLENCLDEYEELNVIQLNPSRTKITFVQIDG